MERPPRRRLVSIASRSGAPREATDARGDGDAGVTLVLVALFMVTLLIIAAIIVDLGQERAIRRSAQSAVDLTTLAATQALAKPDGQDPRGACEEAVRYARLNIKQIPSATNLDCGQYPASGTCDANTAPIVVSDSGTASPYSMAVTWPVPASMIQDTSLQNGSGLRPFDGAQPEDQCSRFQVKLGLTTKTFFSGIVNRADLHSDARAVGRRLTYEETRPPSLWLLEPYACDALDVSGGASVHVLAGPQGGLVTADSAGLSQNCGGSDYVITTNGGGFITADSPGNISLYAFADGQTACTTNPNQGNVHACNPADNITPPPTKRYVRATRAPVDWRFNCKSSYPPEFATDYPPGIPVFGCPDAASKPAYIDALTATAPGMSYTNTWPQNKNGCTLNNGDLVKLSGNTDVACAKLSIKQGGTLIFTGGNVKFEGSVAMEGGNLILNGDPCWNRTDSACETWLGGKTLAQISAAIEANPASPTTLDSACAPDTWNATSCFAQHATDAAWIYQVDGGFSMNNGAQLLVNGAPWVQDASGPGLNDFSATGGSVYWQPAGEGPFEGLSLWSEEKAKPSQHPTPNYAIGGGGELQLAGVFFTPEAKPMTITGNSSYGTQDAQFVSRTLVVNGGATLTLTPENQDLVNPPPPSAVLIR